MYPTTDPDFSRRTSGGVEQGAAAPVRRDPEYASAPPMYNEMPAPPQYEPPVPVQPTNMAYPAVRPMSSKQMQEHSGRVATPPRETQTPVDTDGKY